MMIQKMRELLTNFEGLEVSEIPPKKPTPTKTKTIRFSGEDLILWEAWNKDFVKKIKKFLREQISQTQILKHEISNADNPELKKKDLLKDKRDLIKFMMKKGAKQETLDRLSREYWEIQKIQT